MKKTNLIICAFAMLGLVISGCGSTKLTVSRIKADQRYDGETGPMTVNERDSVTTGLSGYTLFWQSPRGYANDPTAKGNEHLRECIIQAATTNEFDVVRRAPFDAMLARNGKSILIISEPGEVGVKVLDKGVAKYAFYHSVEEEKGRCRYFDDLMGSAASEVFGVEVALTRHSPELAPVTPDDEPASADSEDDPEGFEDDSADESIDELADDSADESADSEGDLDLDIFDLD